jgi:hypothetical protein
MDAPDLGGIVSISDLILPLGSRSDGYRRRRREVSPRLGFRREIAGEGVQRLTSGKVPVASDDDEVDDDAREKTVSSGA